MLTVEKLLEILRRGHQRCAHDMYTSERGLAYFSGYSIRTLRAWRETWREGFEGKRKGPRPRITPRVVYELAEIVAWWEQTADGEQQKAGDDRRESAGTGTDRKTAT
jgi:hypothetical protein